MGDTRRHGRWSAPFNALMVIPAILMTPIWLAQGVAQIGRRHGKKASRRAGATGALARNRNQRQPWFQRRDDRPSHNAFAPSKARREPPKRKKKKNRAKKGPCKNCGAGNTDLDTNFTINGKATTKGATDGGKAAIEQIKGAIEQAAKEGVVAR